MPFCGMSQSDSSIVFDRPGIADGPYIVGKKHWQFESGFSIAEGDPPSAMLNPSVMLRKAIWKRQEIRIAYNYVPQNSFLMASFDSLSQTNFAIGTKLNLLYERRLLPEAALYLNTFYPLQQIKNFRSSGIYHVELGLLMQNNFGEKFALNYNVGFIASNLIKKGMATYSICFTYAANDKLAFFVEQFSYIPIIQKDREFSYDCGITFSPFKKHQFDISYVANHASKRHYGSLLVGYSFLI